MQLANTMSTEQNKNTGNFSLYLTLGDNVIIVLNWGRCSKKKFRKKKVVFLQCTLNDRKLQDHHLMPHYHSSK